MLELNIYQNQNESAETFGKWYARVESKDQMSVYDMAKHMAKHNTPFSAGTIEAIIKPNSTSNAPVNTGGNTGGNTGNGNNVAAPTISGTTPFTETTSVTMSADSGAEIRYTTDGSTPTAQSTLYSTAISLSSTTTMKAIAIKDGVSSSVATKTFTKTSGGGGEDDGGDAN